MCLALTEPISTEELIILVNLVQHRPYIVKISDTNQTTQMDRIYDIFMIG